MGLHQRSAFVIPVSNAGMTFGKSYNTGNLLPKKKGV
jgi:hypothetical protein